MRIQATVYPAIYVDSNGFLRAQLWTVEERPGGQPGINPLTSNAPVNDGAWHHMALMSFSNRDFVDADVSQWLYVDGEHVDTQFGRDIYIDHLDMSHHRLGAGSVVGDWPDMPTSTGFVGDISEFRVWKKPVDPSVQEFMTMPLNGKRRPVGRPLDLRGAGWHGCV